jgi:hypothetical protein
LKIIEKNNVIGVIGAGHFCATYKKECLYKFKKNSCVFVKMGGEIMKEFIDDPISKLDFWRLSSLKNYTYHLGNVTEEWMTGKFKSIKKNEKNIQLTLPNSRFNESSFKKKMKYLITRKLLFKTIYKKLD